MIGVLLGLYIITCILLIVIILLQPTEGGGLSEAFGGGQVQTIFGTKTTSFLVKTTTFLAIIFLSICLILAATSGRRTKSLFESNVSTEAEQTLPAEKAKPVLPEAPVPVEKPESTP